jgi:hypothetical protein
VFNPLQGLMHDAPEAYIGDMVRPLKLSMPDYRVAEGRIWDAVCERFGIEKLFHPEVKRADNCALMTERRDVCTPTDYLWSLDGQGFHPYDFEIHPLDPKPARLAFMERWEQLTQ